MEEFEDWEIEEYRTKFECEEHWALKKDFIATHKNSFSRQRLLCLAQVFVNIQLFRCKYPDPIMRQVAELSEGIGKDYKTRQKERLQRTFVKASDAAKAKVLGLKQQIQAPNSLGGLPNTISFVKEAPTESSTNREAQRMNPQTILEESSYVRFMNTDCRNVSTEILPVLPINSVKPLKRKNKNKKVPIYSRKIAAIVDTAAATSELSEKLASSLDLNSEDSYMSNLFFMYKSFLNFSNFYTLLRGSAGFCNYELINNFHVEETSGESICTLSVKVRGKTLTLGSGKDIIQNISQEKASKDAFTNILKRCHVIEIKKLVSGTEEVSLEKLIRPPDESKISNDSIGAKMMKSMGWSGGALGKTGQGIVEPVKTQNVVGRQGLGIQTELRPTPLFLKKVRNLLDEMVKTLRTHPEAVVPDLIFSSELSNEQRKQIHLIVIHKYPQLKSLSHGKEEDRFLSVKPKLDSQTLFHKINLQGGVTDQYTIHKPGTLSLEDITKMNSTLIRTNVGKSFNAAQAPNYVLTPSDCYSMLESTLKSVNLVLVSKYKINKDRYFNCKMAVTVEENDYFLGSHRGVSKHAAKLAASVRAVLMFIERTKIAVQEIENWIKDNKINLEPCMEQIAFQSVINKKEERGAQQTFRNEKFHVSFKQTFRDCLFENIRKCIYRKRSNKRASTSVEEADGYPYDSYIVESLKRVEEYAIMRKHRQDHALLDSFDLSSSSGLNGFKSALTQKVKGIDGLERKPFYSQFIQDLVISLCDDMKAEDVLKTYVKNNRIEENKFCMVYKELIKDKSYGRKEN